MRGHLWKYYLEDDVEAFQHLLDGLPVHGRPAASTWSLSLQSAQASPSSSIGGPSGSGASPIQTKRAHRDGSGGIITRPATTPTRADINSRDANGLSILHHAASSTSKNALSFATALLQHPLTDLYAQDHESGWTALHRALYFGNIAIALSIMYRDMLSRFGHLNNRLVIPHADGLIRIKDAEGNGPLDLFATTVATCGTKPQRNLVCHVTAREHADVASYTGDDGEDSHASRQTAQAIGINGDELFTFGSNRNVTLGFGDGDDRQFPERIVLRRPDHLLRRLHREHLQRRQHALPYPSPPVIDSIQSASIPHTPASQLPVIIRSAAILIRDIEMAKLSSALLTADPESNLYMCGHGPGGRLGTGDELTRFQFVCIEGGALSGKKVAAVALGQNHTLALSAQGEVISWGKSSNGQLGYSLPQSSKEDDSLQLLPRQVYGPLKKDVVVGIAASRIHSVAYTASSLYTFGKNEGQLGIVDSDARSLESQVTPRKVAASLFSSSIKSARAIERATVCLLENHEVWVFANYGYAKLSFPLEDLSMYFPRQTYLPAKYHVTPNRICKITVGGDSICALSTAGEIYTVAVNKSPDAGRDGTTSTTNPSKIRGALSRPYKIWSLMKDHMAARDVGVDQDGSIILTTQAGTVWRRVKRATIKSSNASSCSGAYRSKDCKFLRVPGLTRVKAVRASAFGSYAAVRKDCDMTRTSVQVGPPTLLHDVFPLLPIGVWRGRPDFDARLTSVFASPGIEQALTDVLLALDCRDKPPNMLIGSTSSHVRIPVHQCMFAARSRVLRHGLAHFRRAGSFSLPDVLSLQPHDHGAMLVDLDDVDIFTVFNLVVYLYTDCVLDFWHSSYKRHEPNLVSRFRQVRIELMRLSARLELKQLEAAVRLMAPPIHCLATDMQLAMRDASFFDDGDVVVELADGELRAHSALMVQRCPFFRGMFKGRSAGHWLASRREASTAPSEPIRIDLRHIELRIFEVVLRHLYADTGEELFDEFVSDNLGEYLALDDFLNHVMGVMSVANELMLDRLSQVCQQVVGRYVNARNVCQLLNFISPFSVTGFKNAGLKYICLSLEAVLHTGTLGELDESLILELDQVVRKAQADHLPHARNGRAELLLHRKYPALAEQIRRNRLAELDAIALRGKHSDGLVQNVSIQHMSTSKHEKAVEPADKRDALIDPAIASPSSHAPLGSLGPMDAATSISISRRADKPWGATPFQTTSVHLKDIMIETSSTKQSGIPLAFATRDGEDRSAGSFTTKLSQKERKRLQQQATRAEIPTISPSVHGGSRPTVSPWLMKPGPSTKAALTGVARLEPAVASTQLQHKQQPSTMRPSLTKRQTIANHGTMSKVNPEGSMLATTGNDPASSSSKGFAIPRPDASSSSATVLPHSIRHTAMTSDTEAAANLHVSLGMTDILSMQQAEKDTMAIAATAKCSLQDIQQEQEFQEWWDKESKRVMNEERAMHRRQKRGTVRTAKKAKVREEEVDGKIMIREARRGGRSSRRIHKGRLGAAHSQPCSAVAEKSSPLVEPRPAHCPSDWT